MKLLLDNVRTKVTEATEDELSWLDAYLSNTSVQFRRGRFRDKTTGKIPTIRYETNVSLLDKRNNTFPSGMLHLIRKQGKIDGVISEVTDRRAAPCAWNPGADVDWLYDYQFNAIMALNKQTRGIVHAPTGGGKSDIVVALPIGFACHWLFMVHRKGLVADVAQRYTEHTGLASGSTLGELQPDPLGRFTCGTFQSITNKLGEREMQDFMASIDGLIVDECHSVAAKSFERVANACKNAYWRIGFSATPLQRSDEKSIMAIACFGPIIAKVELEELIERKIVARPKVTAVKCEQDVDYETWQEAYKHLVIDSHVRNALLVDLAVLAKKPTILFVKWIAHGRLLEKFVRLAGVKVKFIWGGKIEAQRAAIVKALRYGNIDCLIASVVMQDGANIPEIESVIIACGGKCLGIDEPVLRFDGGVVAAQDVRAGDLLMGPDSTPRKVGLVSRGTAQMYRIVPKSGYSWLCNDKHLLTVAVTDYKNRISVHDIPVEQMRKLLERRKSHGRYTLFSASVDFLPSAVPLPLDPYFVGLWYGDGTKDLRRVQITNMDPEIVPTIYAVAERFRLSVKVSSNGSKALTYTLTGGMRGGACNALLTTLRYVVGEGERLPLAYITASRADRLEFLAGLIDTDGSVGGATRSSYEITQKREGFADGICLLANSLGLRATKRQKFVDGALYWRVFIHGDCHIVPCRIARKQLAPRIINPAMRPRKQTHTSFSIEDAGVGEYAGFSVDGDGRFLLADCTVTHNSDIAALQRVGRGMRSDGGRKETVDVYEIKDAGNKHITRHANKRLNVYREAGYDVEVVSREDLGL